MKDGKYEKWCVGRCMMIYITALKHPVRCISLIYLKVENFQKYLFSIRENQNVISTNILLVILLKNEISDLICYIVNRLITNYDKLGLKQKQKFITIHSDFMVYHQNMEKLILPHTQKGFAVSLLLQHTKNPRVIIIPFV